MGGPRLRPVADPTGLRQVFGTVPAGVLAVCGLDGEVPVGMAASSFTSVSLDPPLVSVCVQRTSTTWPVLAGLPRLGLSVLGAGQDELCRRLSARGVDRFAGTRWSSTGGGAVHVDDAVAWFECAPHDDLPAGDHRIVLLRVLATATVPAAEPLVFHGGKYRSLSIG
ncbi:flavin reductase family protein [Saccharopolyspora gloriosae]|uniref:Flavin reductase (DIM6/NTAB) family NADH-FMN oxidoreductase RutF n=1 Tax=Saccharopolyspora gloriosae TaxID=455344 RepID=A0A840NJW3_9PSEU|nr:flavin reductase family protein [Saccharopolyspora gloriosae]MBB5070598.1 flavin reductase (DIM6/NTAB) family NADH-FMN oxidoreductase RutF [Saccharopolyspora gloriosae]